MQVSDRVQEISNEQGWTDETVGQLAINFLRENGLLTRFHLYLEEVQAEENGKSLPDYQPAIISVDFNTRDVTSYFNTQDEDATMFLESNYETIRDRLICVGNEMIEQLGDEAGLKRHR